MTSSDLAPPYRSTLDMIGNTPILEVTRMDTGPCQLFLKLENQNPGGSIKDRIAKTMIGDAEATGKLKPGGVIVEATAGNTGLGLALVAAQKGYRLLIVMPDKMSREKIYHLRALGADVVMTRSDVGRGHPDYYQDKAEAMAREMGGFFVNQFANPANPKAHETGTAPEIWQQLGGRLDAFVCGVGSGGTLTGCGRFFKRVAPNMEILLADPKGSILAEKIQTGRNVEAGSWLVEGIGEDFVPSICDLSLVTSAMTIADAEALGTVRELLRREGILAGTSSGTLIAAALRYCRAQTSAKRVATFVCDTGNKYLSKAFNDYWMIDQGLLARETFGDLRDLIARRPAERAVVTVGPEDTLAVAHGRMKLHDVSQLPVLQGNELVGIIDETDLLLAVKDRPQGFRNPVRDHMTDRVETLEPTAPLSALMPIFESGKIAIVRQDGEFLGLIARIDLLNHLRQQMR
jgi:cystathionine beta-synthase